ncbi:MULTISPECIES: DUF3152 domain-containing protein [Streptomycetaceae]|uniref:DUF3152 domain-containing protein n=1 Tax=Streptantibioticus cattleyicolor (strain ATCC 35852 / DSM 46488 / JCM 4925 / NBRC 14057 / NRRL 8057) TaxID=1003195 RepID=F8K4M9_STREN|nr:DUF3152 domain-containing protein [Streptantibioticus cattleyicolor]AEW96385.1 hypothetical protein SCATT_40140 [Streptantibioticus cattleyicolor NRRL 8057 = DSM 46488]MYS60898.1 DUF3152 domain-containing protein [Streptomyces sp. SID5468]CCB76724.1 conserved protein of unknown function [Streptantibioticus cattleyicolor NRRL 8057 = DSM 46488]
MGRHSARGRTAPEEARPSDGTVPVPAPGTGRRRKPQGHPGHREPPARPHPDETAATDDHLPRPGETGARDEEGAAPARTRRVSRPLILAGAAAAAVTAVLAVVVGGPATGGGATHDEGAAGHGPAGHAAPGAASRSDQRPTPDTSPARLDYDQAMAKAYPLDPKLALDGTFRTVPGHDPAPGHGTVLRYRVDVEDGLPLDGALFAQAVQRTLNDDRSWAHGGTRTFERVSGGHPDFVITLASPGTTAQWCAKSGLDTLDENVSCDSAATDRVMINAYRWAQGAATYGPGRMHMYRQMLINHEVGHRLGHNHEKCPAQGALAPVMMQQTKFLTLDGVTCKPNPWPYPAS